MSPLARDIIVVLVLKALALALLWFAFFRTPSAPQMQMDAQQIVNHVVAPSRVPEIPDAVR
jgi:hypothetical protein